MKKRLKFDISSDQEQIQDPLLRPLFDDMVESERLLDDNDSPFMRRTFYRAAFAFIEGHVYWIKGNATQRLISNGIATGSLNVTHISTLLDQAPRVQETGKIKLEGNRIPFPNYVALVFRTMAGLMGLDAAAFFSDGGWGHLRKAIKVRDRITHPKNPQELNITDSQMDNIRCGLRWVWDCSVEIVNRNMEIAEAKKKGPNK